VLGSINCVLTAKIGALLFRKKIGVIAGFLACVYPMFIYFDGELLIPTLLIFFMLLGFYLAFTQRKQFSTKWRWLIDGVCWGFAAIVRPNVLLFLVTVPAWFFRIMKRQWKKALLFSVIGVALIIVPITIRNFILSREIVLIAWQGGTNFYIGNNPHADGYTAIAPGTRKTWWGGYNDMKRIAEQNTGRQLTGGEIDRYWMKQGTDFIIKQPGKALYLWIKKTYLFFSGIELSNNRDIYFFTRLTFLKFLIINIPFFQFPFGVILPLALVGILLFFKQLRSSGSDHRQTQYIIAVLFFLGTYAVSFIVFFVCARYRLPVIPFLLMFAGSAITQVIQSMKQKQYRNLIVPLCVFAGSYVFFNANIFNIQQVNPGLNYSTLGVAYKDQGNIEKAVVSYKRAIDLDPGHADAYYNLGNIYAQRKQFEVARDLYGKAISIDPYAARAYSNLGNVYFETNKLDSALYMYDRAIEIEPDYETPYCHAGLVYQKLGEFAKAESLWMECLKYIPQSQRARDLLRTLNAERY
jgi:tetratricopeptide (TPR) repeat protein